MTGAAQDTLRRLGRLLKEATGEAKWDDYLAECRSTGATPMSRKEFELHRAHQQECRPGMRCC